MVSIVLCRPEGSYDIGAVCRAMRTMQLTSLVLVAPAPIKEDEVKQWSLKSFNLYQQAAIYADLKTALSGFSWVVGVSRRHGRNRKQYALTPEEMAEQISAYQGGRVALVFGNEKNGLNEKELRLCHSLVTIPADPEYGSLNLSHAVQICAYALFRHNTKLGDAFKQGGALVSQTKIDALAQHVVQHMDEQGIFREGRDDIKYLTYSRLYDILGRIPLRESDIYFLQHTCDKMIYAPKQPRA